MNAAGWWGLRAYSWRTLDTNAVRLRRDSDNAEQDFATIAGGGLDLTAISSFKGAANLFVVTLYDQSGNGVNATQSSAANQPAFILSGIGSLPVIRCTTAEHLTTSLDFSTFANSSCECVIKPTTGANITIIGGRTSTGYQHRLNSSGNLELLKQSTASIGTSSGAISSGTWAATGVTYNGTDAAFFINGSASGTASNSQSFTSDPAGLFARLEVSERYSGDCAEIGVWDSILASGTQSSLSANQHAYWGF